MGSSLGSPLSGTMASAVGPIHIPVLSSKPLPLPKSAATVGSRTRELRPIHRDGPTFASAIGVPSSRVFALPPRGGHGSTSGVGDDSRAAAAASRADMPAGFEAVMPAGHP